MKKHTLIIAPLALLGLLLVSAIALGSSLVSGAAREAGWSVAGPDGVEAPPGEFVTLVLRIANDGETPGSFRWRVQVPPGWMAVVPGGQIELAAGDADPVFITFLVPDTTLAGLYSISITVINEDTGESQRWESRAEVPARRGIALEQGMPPVGYPGERVEHQLVVRNSGNIPETVQVTASATSGWRLEPHETTLTLDAGARVVVPVRAHISRETPPGVVRGVRADIRTADGMLAETLRLTTTVRPPHPDLVPPPRADTLPATLRFTTGAMREGKRWSPELTLTARGRIGENSETELSLGAGVKQDEGRAFVSHIDTSYVRLPYSLRIGVRRGRAAEPFRETFTLIYDELPWWLALGDVSLGPSPLISTSGRGGVVRYFHPEGADYGMFMLGETVGFTLGSRSARSRARFTALDGAHPQRPVVSLHAQFTLTDEVTIEGETVAFGHDRAWFVGGSWDRAPWSVLGRYFWYGATAVPGAGGGRSGYEAVLRGVIGNAPFSMSVSEMRTNVLQDPNEPVDAVAAATFASSFPIGRAGFRGALRWDQRQTLVEAPGVIPRDRSRLSGDVSLQRRSGDWYWIVRARASETHDRSTDEHDATFSLGPSIGRAWPTVRVGVGLVWHGVGDSLSQAWADASLGPSVSINWRPRVRFNPDFGLTYFGGERPRLLARASFELTNSLDLHASADARKLAAQPEWTYRAGITYRFGLPIPGVYSRGGIEGQVYLVNDDTAAAVDDLEGIVVSAGGIRVSTDSTGRFRFPPLRGGEYEVRLENAGAVGVAYEPQIDLPILVEVHPGETTEVAIPLRLMARLTGRVYFDAVQSDDVLKGSLAGIELELRQEGNVIARVTTDSLGFYETPLLEPGQYEVTINYATLPRWTEPMPELPTTVSLEAGRIVRYDVGLSESGVPIRLDVDL